MKMKVLCTLTILVAAVGLAAPKASALKVPKGWKIASSASGDLVPGGGIETVVVLKRNCVPAKCGKAKRQEVIVTQGKMKKRIATLSTGMHDVMHVSVNGKEISLDGMVYTVDDPECCDTVGFFETWTYENGTFVKGYSGDAG
jgi:hypothetical protein